MFVEGKGEDNTYSSLLLLSSVVHTQEAGQILDLLIWSSVPTHYHKLSPFLLSFLHCQTYKVSACVLIPWLLTAEHGERLSTMKTTKWDFFIPNILPCDIHLAIENLKNDAYLTSIGHKHSWSRDDVMVYICGV